MPVIFLTTTGTGTWTVPADWNSSNNTIECIGGGAGGQAGNLNGGGGGGAYSAITNLALTPSASVSYAVGAGGASATAGGDTWFNGANLAASSVGAKGGATAAGGGAGGQAADGIGATRYSGGNGGGSSGPGGGGGGGAAGPSGNGAAGGSAEFAGGGGGGANGGAVGHNHSADHGAYTGGDGGAGVGGTGGGIGSSTAADGGAGSAGGGGGGGNGPDGSGGGAGGSDTAFDATHGCGGGGGGAGGFGSTNPVGGAGGTYGGGGGAGGNGSSNPGGAGGQGLIVITYTASSTAAYGGAFGEWAHDCGAPVCQQQAAVEGFAGFVYAAEPPQPYEPANFFGSWETPISPIWLRTTTGGSFDDFGQNVESATAETPVFTEWPAVDSQRFVTPHDFSSFVHQQAPPVYCFDAFWENQGSLPKNGESFQDFATQIALPEEAVYGGSFGEWWSVPQSASFRGEGAHEFGGFEQTQEPPPPPPYGAVSDIWPAAFFQAARGCDFWSFVIEGAVIEAPAVDVDGVYRPRKPVKPAKRAGPKPDYSIYNRPTSQPEKKEPVSESVEEESLSDRKAEAKAPLTAAPKQTAEEPAPPKKTETILSIDVALPGLGVKPSKRQKAEPAEKPQEKVRPVEQPKAETKKPKTEVSEKSKEESEDVDEIGGDDDEVVVRLISEKVEGIHNEIKRLLSIYNELVSESKEILELLKED